MRNDDLEEVQTKYVGVRSVRRKQVIDRWPKLLIYNNINLSTFRSRRIDDVFLVDRRKLQHDRMFQECYYLRVFSLIQSQEY